MASTILFTPFTPIPPNRNTVRYKVSDPIPSLDELLALEKELHTSKAQAFAISRKAGGDLQQLKALLKKAPEPGKKQEEPKKVKETKPPVKRKDSVTATPETDLIVKLPSVASKPIPPLRKPGTKAVNKPGAKAKANNKKHKRQDSDDDEVMPARFNKRSTPLPPPISKSSPNKPQTSSSRLVDDFSLSASNPLSPKRPPLRPAPVPGPVRQEDVSLDLSAVPIPPQGSQITTETYFKNIAEWMRPVGPEDAAALAYVEEDPEPFQIPELGRHYLDVWADEDERYSVTHTHGRGTALGTGPSPWATAAGPFVRPAGVAPTPSFDPTTLSEVDFRSEEKSLGASSERVLAALIPTDETGALRTQEFLSQSLEGPLVQYPVGEMTVNAEELETRMKRNLEVHDVRKKGEEPDFSGPSDDTILAELRHSQRLLRMELAKNAARKVRLLRRCEDRLAYQDYSKTLEKLDEKIMADWNRLLPKQPAKKKKKKKTDDSEPKEHKKKERIEVPPALLEQVRLRQRYVETLGATLDELERQEPGRFYTLPLKSIYEGMTIEEGEAIVQHGNKSLS